MNKAAGDKWAKSIQTLYDTLKREIKSDNKSMWMDYIGSHEVLETLNESIAELNFSE